MRAESPAFLRHEFRTPVNHIVGYSELLIEDAATRGLEPFIPALRQIHSDGRALLEAIQHAFGEHEGSADGAEEEAFRNLQAMALGISRTLTSTVEDMERCHSQTLADLEAISWAVRHLIELAGRHGEVDDPQRLRPARRAEDVSRDIHAVPAKRGGGRILIADDDAANRDLLRRRLECEGHEVVEARDGLEVLAALRDSSCDLVLLDILMPAMDGYQTLARMKQDARLRELPVIMISALDELNHVVRCIEMGAEDYLPKPFNRVLLRARIGASLEKKWLRDRERRKTEELEQTLRLLEQAQDQLAVLASRDGLTGLANRRAVEAELDLRVRRATPFTAVYIDLNGFKKINDTYGHAAGDDLLGQVGYRLQMAFRPGDVIGRWGGDEFVALVDLSLADVRTTIFRVGDSLAGDFVIGQGAAQHRVKIGAAIGVAAWKPGDSATEVLQRADFAMYEDKLRHAG